MESEKRIAILIDSDNVSPKYLRAVLREVASYGRITYKRIYGDWSAQNLSSWRRLLLDTGFLQIQQSRYVDAKNSTDAAMIIDAMDILYGGAVDAFCLVTSDSDFSRLAIRLKESGMEVIGMGERKTPSSFVASCTIFKDLDVLIRDDDSDLSEPITNGKNETSDDASYRLTDKREIMLAIQEFVQSSYANNLVDSQGVNIASLGSHLQKRFPEFDVRNYGFSKLSTFLESMKGVNLNYDGLKVFLTLDESLKVVDRTSLVNIIKNILTQNKGSMKISELNKRLQKEVPNFNLQNLGYSKLGTFLNDEADFEVRWNTVRLR
ncbi:MAG: NYN domain-containing protein [Treponemataceae bacterium]